MGRPVQEGAWPVQRTARAPFPVAVARGHPGPRCRRPRGSTPRGSRIHRGVDPRRRVGLQGSAHDTTRHHMSTTTTGARIEIRGLSKQFGSFVAVDDLSFDVEPGRITGFLGPNGAGKTTTLRMLLGLVHADERHRDDRRAALRRPPRPARDRGGRPRGDELPPGPQRPRPPARPRGCRLGAARSGSTSCSSSPASPPPPASGPASTAWACASGSASRPRSSATPGCSSSTSRPTAWTPRASAGCAASCATSAREGKTILVSSHLLQEVEQTVDEVVIIANGRLVRAGAMAELHGTPGCASSAPPTPRASPAPCASPTSRAPPAPTASLVADTTDLRLVGDVALRAGPADLRARAPSCRPRGAVLRAHRGHQPQRGRRGRCPRRAGRRDRPGRGEPVIPAIRSEFRKFFTTRLWWGMAIGIFLAGAAFAALFGFLLTE